MFRKALFLVGILFIAYYWQTRIKQGPIYYSDKLISGKTVVITGGNAGIGKYTAIEVAKRKARVIIASRNVIKSEQAKKEIIEASGNNNVKVMKLDLEDFKSVKKFAEELLKTEENIDYLVNNAGGVFMSGLTSQGYNRAFTVNHLGHFLLTNLLLDKIKSQSVERPVRIINISSGLHGFGKLEWESLHFAPVRFLDHMQAYANSKLANIYFTKELASQLKSYPGISTYSIRPGFVASDIAQEMPSPILKFLLGIILAPFKRNTIYGAQVTMYAILDDNLVEERDNNGGYLTTNFAVDQPSLNAQDEKLGEELWKRSLKMVGVEE